MDIRIIYFALCIFHAIAESSKNNNLLHLKPDSKYNTTNIRESLENKKEIVVRKCCEPRDYYNTESHECVTIGNHYIFEALVNKLLLNGRNYSLLINSKKMRSCPNGRGKIPDTATIMDPTTHSLLADGILHHHHMDLIFDTSHYCLEMVGDSIEIATLTFIYCLSNEKIFPKCCPKNHYYDLRDHDCSPFYGSDQDNGVSKLLVHLGNDSRLAYKEKFTCQDPPEKINLDEARFFKNNLCLRNTRQCYHTNKYCIDNVWNNQANELTQSVYVCPENFIHKCCSEGMILDSNGCKESSRMSLLIAHILHNSRYHVKSFSHLGSGCNPVIIDKNIHVELGWTINPYGKAEIRKNNQTIQTDNYCVDDYQINASVFPVIKVCSDEVKIYHHISPTTVESQNTLGKCCPGNKLYRPHRANASLSTCVEKPEEVMVSLKQGLIQAYNISHLLYTYFPNCSTEKGYHKYSLRKLAYHDYATLTSERILKIIRKDNNCEVKESLISPSDFCVDFIERENQEYEPVAVICISNVEFHKERNILVVCLVGVSCTALISTFFSLLFMRVRRGMVTVKKINTLAGRILISYVLSQLVGFFILGVGIIMDFEEDFESCLMLAGILMFFLIASFCWNTSICLEGLLLTMHIQMSESHRYVFHSIWAWGLPTIFTGAALIKDSQRDSLPCNAITPNFGVEKCFFSDPLAQLLYFYFPIALTVTTNAILLVSAKIIRRRKLKELEKDPHRVRNHETLQQVLSIKSIKSKLRGEPSIKPVSNRSGLRTHHNRNVWLESLKLVLWSGTTWLLEIIGTLVTMHIGRPHERWYHYLWYFPVGFNCLRGVGIFLIISLNSSNNSWMTRTINTFSSRFNTSWGQIFSTRRQRRVPPYRDWRGNAMKKLRKNDTIFHQKGEKVEGKSGKVDKTRSTSVSTTITEISSSTIESSPNECVDFSERENPRLYYHSISELYIQRTLPEFFEDKQENEQPTSSIIEEDHPNYINTMLHKSTKDFLSGEENKKRHEKYDDEKEVFVCVKKPCIEIGGTICSGESFSGVHEMSIKISESDPEIKDDDYKEFYYCTRL